MHIRKARLDDALGIAKVSVNAWRSTYKGIVPDDFLEKMTIQKRVEKWKDKISGKKEIIYVVEVDEGLVGYASGGEERGRIKKYDGELYAIYLLENFQKSGLGKLLLSYLAPEMEDRGYTSLLVWVLEANHSKNFYKRLGGEEIAEDKMEISGIHYRLLAFGWSSIRELRNQLSN
ncbi:N-acetyltransferase family protein [Halobacillus mangrovi]|uniref:GNAT family N-acetyltransferase n=1 Tax=Halobacillus mangrovi TaxID=402384 RepID=UPI003D99BD3B